MIPSSDYYKIVFAEWPAWEKIDGRKEPNFVRLSIIKGKDKSSNDIAIVFDDLANGNFWYRDHTQDGLPFVDDGELYWSVFVFQEARDARQFHKAFGGELNPNN